MKTNYKTSWAGQFACTVALFFIIGLFPQFTHARTNDNDTGQLTLLRDKAEKGDAQAQCDLADVYVNGKVGGVTNYLEAVKLYRKAAEQGNARAEYNMGVACGKGQGVAKDEVEAVKWYRRAADQGDAEAQLNLAECYRNGNGVEINLAEVVNWYRKAAEQNLAKAQCNLGVCYSRGKGIPTDYEEAVKWYRKAAEQGNADAQLNLGACYERGRGVPTNKVEAVKWYRKAAEQGNAEAQFSLGNYYFTGEGVATDYEEAVKCYRKAAVQGEARAQVNMGVCYATGQGVPKDTVEAAKWYRKAADQNLAKAQNYLGDCYLTGQNGTNDLVEAYKWWLLAGAQGYEVAKRNARAVERGLTPQQRAEGQKRAGEFKPLEAASVGDEEEVVDSNLPADLLAKAKSGDAQAQNELGRAFHTGTRGAAKNDTAAVNWLRLAASQNYAPAQANLADCYERGEGVAKYEVEAYKWDLLAAAQGDKKAKNSVTILELLLSEGQIAEGKQRAQDWLQQFRMTPLNSKTNGDPTTTGNPPGQSKP